MHGHSYKVEIEVRGTGRPGDGLADRLRRHRRRLARAVPALRPPQPERGPRARELDLREHRDLRLAGAAAAHRGAVGGDVWETYDSKCTYRGGDRWPTSKRPVRFLTLNLWGENGPWQARMDLLLAQPGRARARRHRLQEVRDVPGRVPNQAGELARRSRLAPRVRAVDGLGRRSRRPGDRVAVPDRRARGAAAAHTASRRKGESSCRRASTRDAGEIWVHTTHLAFRETEGRKREDQVLFIDAGRRRARQRQHPDRDGRLQRRPRQRRDPLAERA